MQSFYPSERVGFHLLTPYVSAVFPRGLGAAFGDVFVAGGGALDDI